MIYRRTIILCILVLFSSILSGQEWVRTYGDTISTLTYKAFEHYDHGYILLGKRYVAANTKYGWIMKTDINGYERWQKSFGDETSSSPLFGIDQYPDGGFITIGQTSLGNPHTIWKALVIKINACGEKEWCRIYYTPGRQVYGLDIQQIPGGGSIAMVGNWGYDEDKTLWLLGLDENGDITWEQAYCTDSIFWDPQGQQLFRMQDTTFLITGIVYSPDSGQTNPYWKRPMLIKVKPDGTALFELAWGASLEYSGSGWVSIENTHGNIYTGTQQLTLVPPICGPGIIQTTVGGQPVYFQNLVDTATIGGATTIDWFQDSTLALGLVWKQMDTLGAPFNIGVMKTDSLGNTIKYKQLIFNGDQAFNDADVTFDNKLFIVNSDYYTTNWVTKAFKLNSDLEYDSIYTTPFTYDSLCPHPIVSDTIPLDDCEVVVVGIDDPVQHPEKTRLKVYPNPSERMVTVEMPEYLIRTADGGRQTAGIGITATTYYHQWKSVRLDVLNVYGKLLYSEDIPGNTDNVQLDISSWPAGMYVARIVFMNDVVGVAKFVKE
jgi:hypothetical protein